MDEETAEGVPLGAMMEWAVAVILAAISPFVLIALSIWL